MKQKIELKAEDITLFAVASSITNWDDLLVGLDNEGRTAFWGGKKDAKRDVHIVDTLDGEGFEEIGGTIYPHNFIKQGFQQHFIFAHEYMLPFFTSKATQLRVKKEDLGNHHGDLKLRIGVRMFEISGKLPVEVNAREMGQPVYRKVSPDEPNMRESVRLLLKLSEETECWSHDKLTIPDPSNLTRINIKQLRTELCDMGVSHKTLKEHFFFPSDFKLPRELPRQIMPHSVAA